MQSQQLFCPDKALFFRDPRKLGALALERFPEEAKAILAAADRFANREFLFQQRWDMEQTHSPVCFPEQIDWLHQPGDDPEFVYAFNRMRYWRILGQAYALTGKEGYAKAFADQMCHWVRSVRPEDPACAKAWRSLDVGYRLVNWCKSVLYFARSPAMSPEVQWIFIRSVSEQAEFIMKIWDSYHLMSNWGVLANHGLFVASVVLPKSDRTKAWQAEALGRLAQELRLQVGPDGMQWEQSPQYHNEVLRCYLDVVLLCQRNGIPMPSGMEEGVLSMARASCRWQKPNGHQPMLGDSDDIDQRDLLTLAAGIFRDGALRFFAYERCDFDSLWDLGEEGLRDFEALQPVPPFCPDQALTSSGNFILRSGWGPEDSYLRFHCGTLGAGHGHADLLHVDLFAGGRELLCDAGRYTYVYGPDRREFKSAAAHNTLTLDGEELYPCLDSWECASLSRGINQKFYADSRCAYAEGGNLGYYSKGVFLNRRVLLLKPDLVVLCDECYGAGPHSLEQYFHWGPGGSLIQRDWGWQYRAGEMGVRMKTLSAQPWQAAPRSSRFAPHYNLAMENPGLGFRFETQGFASCFQVLALDRGGEEEPFTVEKLPVRSNFKGIVFDDSVIEALRIQKGERRWVLVLAHQEFATPTDTFLAGGCTGFGNVVVFADEETEIGTVLVR